MATVLYIEDDSASRMLVRKLLRAAGHRVLEASDGLEGVRIAREQPVDLVLVDIDVPGLDGYEVTLRLRSLRDLDGHLPIVALTAQGERLTSLAVGADGFIEKPIDVRAFPGMVARYLGGHRDSRPPVLEEPLRARSGRIVEKLERRLEELTTAYHRLSEMARLRKEYLRNVTHELATPLTPIIGYLRLLLDGDLGSLNEEQRRCLASMERSALRLRRLVDTLVDVAAFEQGSLRFVVSEYDPTELLSSIREEAEAMARSEGRGLSWKGPQDASAHRVRGDVERLRRAILHVVDNALKFSPPGGLVAVEAEWNEEGRGDVFVADSGPGISSEERERLFEPFFQVDGSRTRRHGGVGLGLALVRRVVRAHGGDVFLSSPPNRSVAGERLPGTLVHLWFGSDTAFERGGGEQ